MRIISGIRRGKKLVAPAGLETRPTLDRVKQIIFDSIQFEIADKRALDLFCGSGQLGLEALSRGAAFCVFNDASEKALGAARQNILACGFEKNARLTCNFYENCVTILKSMPKTQLVFLDPPYHTGLLAGAISALLSADVLAPGAILVCEHGSDETVAVPEGFFVRKSKKCGEVSLTILQEKTA